jgi:hypothetical protein
MFVGGNAQVHAMTRGPTPCPTLRHPPLSYRRVPARTRNQSHTCTNTLQLPNYWDALEATWELQQLGEQPSRTWLVGGSTATSAWLAPRCGPAEEGALRQQCLQVMHERLDTALLCWEYALDD